MPENVQSIEDLIASSDGKAADDESAQGKFQSTQQKIKRKEIERVTEREADRMGLPYVNLFGFPISPEALSLVDEEEARALLAVCFSYDGKNIRVGTTDPERREVKELLKRLCEQYHTEGKLYLISNYSLEYAIELYRAIPKVRKFVRGVEIKEEELKALSV